MLTTQQRVQNYRWQKINHAYRGRDFPFLAESRNLVYDGRLTPRQRRRVTKKLLRQTKVKLTASEMVQSDDWALDPIAQHVISPDEWPSAPVEPLADWEIEMLNECITCQATGDSPCVTKSGNPAKKAHANRPVKV